MQRKLGKAQKALMLEAARTWLLETQSVFRNNIATRLAFVAKDNRKGMVNAWTGIGTRSDYRTVVDAGLMTYVHFCQGSTKWWRMTDKGAILVQSWIHAGLHIGHFDDSVHARYAIDSIIETCRQSEREKSCTG